MKVHGAACLNQAFRMLQGDLPTDDGVVKNIPNIELMKSGKAPTNIRWMHVRASM
jgi:hypothetical protein